MNNISVVDRSDLICHVSNRFCRRCHENWTLNQISLHLMSHSIKNLDSSLNAGRDTFSLHSNVPFHDHPRYSAGFCEGLDVELDPRAATNVPLIRPLYLVEVSLPRSKVLTFELGNSSAPQMESSS